LIKELDRGGVIEARELIDTNLTVDDDNEITLFGFLTDDEIIVVAKFTSDGKFIIDDSELYRAIKYYHKGYCQEILGN
jgi:hypothetical protein